MFGFFTLCLNILCLVSLSTGLPQGVGVPSASKCVVTEEASGQAKPCYLPFTFNNRKYIACTNVSDSDGRPWCSTKIDDEGNHIRKINAWGYCDMSNAACSGQEEVHDPTKSPLEFADESKGTWRPSAMKGECGTKITNENILGGENTKPGEYPYMALLGTKSDDDNVSYHCGGTLINRYYVLTAAHCHRKKQKITKVLIGEHIVGIDPDCTSASSCSPKVQNIDVENVTVHEDFNITKLSEGNDIALVRLARPAILSYDKPEGVSIASPICVPWGTEDPGYDQTKVNKGTVTGWGFVTNNETVNEENFLEFRAGTSILQKAEIPIVKDCFNVTGQHSSHAYFCAGGEDGVDSCKGDSGGPFAYRKIPQDDEPWYLIGIVSFGSRVCGSGFPGVYTKVTNYLDWIEKNMKP